METSNQLRHRLRSSWEDRTPHRSQVVAPTILPRRRRRLSRNEPANSGLAAWQQLVVAAYIEKHIAESITVHALARFVYLTSHCFSRAFKRSFGIPPHRYVISTTDRARQNTAGRFGIVDCRNRSCARLQPNEFVFGGVPKDHRNLPIRILPDPAMTPSVCGKGKVEMQIASVSHRSSERLRGKLAPCNMIRLECETGNLAPTEDISCLRYCRSS